MNLKIAFIKYISYLYSEQTLFYTKQTKNDIDNCGLFSQNLNSF